MRGQWISTTRRLNKHYQNGAGAEDFSWGPFWSCFVEQPCRWVHSTEGGATVDPDTYYNKSIGIYGAAPNFNFAYINHAYGYRSNKKYDGLFYPSYGAGSNIYPLSMTTDLDLNQIDDFVFGSKGVAVCDFDRAYADHDISNCLRLWNHRECEERGFTQYIRVHVPKWGFATPYYWANEEYPPIETSILNPRLNYRLACSEFNPRNKIPVYNGIELTSKATAQHAYVSGIIESAQGIKFDYNGTEYTILNAADNAVNGINFSHYDNVETQHKTYLDTGYRFTAMARIKEDEVDENGDPIPNEAPFVETEVGCRIYVFFYKGDLYIDLVLEVYDPDTMDILELDHTPFITQMRYPSIIFGYPTIDKYVHPDSGYEYPSWLDWINYPSLYNGETFYNMMLGQSVYTGMQYNSVWAAHYSGGIFPRVYPLQEEEFFEMEAAKRAEWGL